jgi:hypothetical protein
MKKKIVISLVVLIVVIIVCLSKCFFYMDLSDDNDFKTLEDRVIAINYYAYKAMSDKIDSDNQRNKKKIGLVDQWYLKKILKALPRDQKTFYMAYANPEYTEEGNNPWGDFKFFTNVSSLNSEFIMFQTMKVKLCSYCYYIFSEFMKYFPKEIVLDKMISIGIGGKYGSSDSVFFVLMDYIENTIKQNPEDLILLSSILEKHTDKDILAFWYFIFDGPHPDSRPNKECYAFLGPLT